MLCTCRVCTPGLDCAGLVNEPAPVLTAGADLAGTAAIAAAPGEPAGARGDAVGAMPSCASSAMSAAAALPLQQMTLCW